MSEVSDVLFIDESGVGKGVVAKISHPSSAYTVDDNVELYKKEGANWVSQGANFYFDSSVPGAGTTRTEYWKFSEYEWETGTEYRVVARFIYRFEAGLDESGPSTADPY